MADRKFPMEFAPYIVDAYKAWNIEVTKSNVFGPYTRDGWDVAAQSPVLSYDRPNRIVVFQGCFNPPHIGHMRMLKNCLQEHVKQRLGIVAAIVVLCSERVSEGKNDISTNPNPLVLSRQQRERLWREAPDFPSDAFVFKAAQKEFFDWTVELDCLVREGGFELQFISLEGADHIGMGKDLRKYMDKYEYVSLMTSDATRPLDFKGDGALKPLCGFLPWMEVIDDEGYYEDDEELEEHEYVEDEYAADDEHAVKEKAKDAKEAGAAAGTQAHAAVAKRTIRAKPSTALPKGLRMTAALRRRLRRAKAAQAALSGVTPREPDKIYFCQRADTPEGMQRTGLYFVETGLRLKQRSSTIIREAIGHFTGDVLMEELFERGALSPVSLFIMVCGCLPSKRFHRAHPA